MISMDIIEEQKTDADEVGGVVTFVNDIEAFEVFNSDPVNSGTFTINGFTITVPAGSGYRSQVKGDIQKTVTITGSTSYEIRRLG
jgi:hypothetical protein